VLQQLDNASIISWVCVRVGGGGWELPPGPPSLLERTLYDDQHYIIRSSSLVLASKHSYMKCT
jgi:hypothetical protein